MNRQVFKSKFGLCVLTGLLSLFAIPASGTTVFFAFTGQVTDDAINGCGVFINCGIVTGTYSFDSAALDGNADPTAGVYAVADITFSIDGVLFFSSASGFINVVDFPGVDQYGLLASGVASNLSAADLSILLSDATATAFGSDALPLDASALTSLLPGTFQLNAGDDSFQLTGTIDSVSTANAPDAVPEPSSMLPLSIGLSLLAWRVRRLTRTAR